MMNWSSELLKLNVPTDRLKVSNVVFPAQDNYKFGNDVCPRLYSEWGIGEYNLKKCIMQSIDDLVLQKPRDVLRDCIVRTIDSSARG